ncbi:hypothetical protein [Clostridium sp. HBUAS56010]|uniref:hypothetical protein n=1 Tax=Clostridium sp. HBUAS56010 TaxID=2571127 RepID=UPI0011784358|nr:hypothetical protein [Clostridium sp. HBUAS56010]
MTEQEIMKCEELMKEAIGVARQARKEFDYIRQHYLSDDMYKCEMSQRRSDRHWGQAEGVYRALKRLGYEHDEMITLEKLINW